jgi:hypothetical protein
MSEGTFARMLACLGCRGGRREHLDERHQCALDRTHDGHPILQLERPFLDRVSYPYFIRRNKSLKTDNNEHKPRASGEKPANVREVTHSYRITPSSSDWYAHLLRESPNVEYMLRTNFDNFPKGKNFAALLEDLLGHGMFNVDGLELGSVMEAESCVLPVLTAATVAGAVVDLQDVFRRFAALSHARHRRGAAAVEGQAPVQRRVREGTQGGQAKLVDEHAAAMTRRVFDEFLSD